MVEDLSKKTIMILVVLTLMISGLGTWAVISELNAANIPVQSGNQGSGRVNLEIVSPTDNAPVTNSATGQVTFEITKPE